MPDVRLRVYRQYAGQYPGQLNDAALHAYRAGLLHGLVDGLHAQVSDWGDTDDHLPHEWVEIVLALGGSAVFMGAVVTIIQSVLRRNEIRSLEVVTACGTKIVAKGITDAQVTAIIEAAQKPKPEHLGGARQISPAP